MKKQNLSLPTQALLLVLSIAFAGAPALAAYDLEPANGAVKKRKVTIGAPREATYRQMEKAYKSIGDGNFPEALALLLKLRDRVQGRRFERAQVEQLIGVIYSSTDRYADAIAAYQRAIDANVMPNRVQFDMMFTNAQLFNALERPADAIKALREWFAWQHEPKVDAYVLGASLYQQEKRYRDAVTALYKAIALQHSLGKEAKENWYRMLAFLHFELEDFPASAKDLQWLVRHYPEKGDYWVQLSQMYVQLKKDQLGLGTLALAYRQGYLTKESEWMQLVNMYAFLEVPFQSARILQQGLKKGVVKANKKHWEQLGNSWYAAQEMDEALSAFKKAGSFAKNGKIDMQRAYILLDLERFPDTVEAVSKALKKGGLKKPGEAYLVLGMALNELKKYSGAADAFRKAMKYKKTKRSAKQWLNHLREEGLITA